MNSSDNGSERKRGLLDTNVIYSALHNPAGVCGKIILLGTGPLVELYSIDLAREELRTNLERKMGLHHDDIEFIVSSLPLDWIPREVYAGYVRRAAGAVGVPQDAPFVAASLATGIPLVSGDAHLHTRKIRRLIRTHRPREFTDVFGG